MNAIRNLTFRFFATPLFTPTQEPVEIENRIRLAKTMSDLCIAVDGAKLIAHVDRPTAPQKKDKSKQDWILAPDLGREPGMAYFTRLRQGETVFFQLEPAEDTFVPVEFEDNPAQVGLFFRNQRGELIIEPRLSKRSARISFAGESPAPQSRVTEASLQECREIYGGSFELLEKGDALAALKAVNDQMETEKWRPRDERGIAGSVLEIPEDIQPIIVGDLHGNLDNFLRILAIPGVLDGLKEKKCCLLMLGDLLHPEDGDLGDMDSSLLLLDVILKLKAVFPRGIFFLRGNHESFSPEVFKRGVPQGVMLEEQVVKKRGAIYRDEMLRFFDLVPFVAKSKDFIAAHAAPTRTVVSMDTLINLRKFPGYAYEITRNRVLKPGFPAGYTKGDVKRFRKSLGVNKKAAFFVGHTPLSVDKGCWLNVQGIKNHHIVYSAGRNQFAVFTRIGDRFLPMEFNAEPLLSFANADIENGAPT